MNLNEAKIERIENDVVTIRLSKDQIEQLGLKTGMIVKVSKGGESANLSDQYFKKKS
jgi:hypothetical protein